MNTNGFMKVRENYLNWQMSLTQMVRGYGGKMMAMMVMQSETGQVHLTVTYFQGMEGPATIRGSGELREIGGDISKVSIYSTVFLRHR